MSKDTAQTWINSKEILKKCGISRATLNNYIKLGIIPRPIVQKPQEDMKKTKKIGYFPQMVLNNIEMVKRLKKEGNSVENIAQKLKVVPISEPVTVEEKQKVSPRVGKDLTPQEISHAGSKELRLTIDNIETPAYLLNYQFEIEWINRAAEEKIFNQSVRLIKDTELRNIFRLFFNLKFHDNIQNWENLFDFHAAFLKSKFSRDLVEKLYQGISESEVSFLKKAYDRVLSLPKQVINQNLITITRQDGSKEPYRLYTTFFREGLFFLYVPSDSLFEGITEFLSNRGQVIKELLHQRMSTLVYFCVLVADLQDSVRICAELPPEEYFELINLIWKTMEESFKKYYGIYGKHVGDGIVYYFLKERGSNYIMNAINCAMEVKEKMEKLSIEWKIRKKWANELYLNIGINEGQEYISAIHASISIEFTALGDTINYAARLSDLAQYGSIFTTKNLMNKLKEEDRKNIRFGVKRKLQDREVFIENTFSRVIDLVNGDDMRRGKFMDITALPVTEIIR